jgi:hypothetical protein
VKQRTTVAQIAWLALAGAALVGFLWAATNLSVYNHTSPGGIAERIFGEDAARIPHEGWPSLHVILRKAYSIVAFTIVGFVLDKALPPTRRRALRAALLVAAFSAVIEVGQKLHHAPEGFRSNLFDIGCGAFGGWLSIALQRVAAVRR